MLGAELFGSDRFLSLAFSNASNKIIFDFSLCDFFKNNPYSNSLWHGYYTAAGKDKESERQALLQAISAIHQVDPLLKPEHVARILNFVDEHPRLLKDNPHKLCYEALRGIAITMRYLTGGEIGSISYGPEEIIQNFLYRSER